MNLYNVASQMKPILEHLYNDGEDALKRLLIRVDENILGADIHNISIARETVNVVWNYNNVDQGTTYLTIEEVQKCLPQTVPLDKEEIKADWLSWAGGETPSDEHQIRVYLDYAASAKYDNNEVKVFLEEWSQESE